MAVFGGGIVTGIIFETHATTTDNEACIATGWLPGELSATGRLQAADLGRRRRGDGIAAVYSEDRVLDPGPWQPGWHYTAPEHAHGIERDSSPPR